MEGAGGATHWDQARRVLEFEFTPAMLERNFDELALFLRYLSDPKVALGSMGTEHRWLWHEASREVLFRLHNYAASAQSLVDHSRVLYRELYEPANLIPDYQAQVTARFASDPLSQFVIKLRQMAQHYRLPIIETTTSFQNTPVKRVTVQLRLVVEDLAQFDGWNASARLYLDQAGEHIVLVDTVEAYHAHVMEFYEWFRAEQTRVHGILPRIYAHIVQHGLKIGPREELEHISTRIAELEKKDGSTITYADLFHALEPGLTVVDQHQLSLCQHNPEVWVNHALRVLSRRFDIPEQLAQRVRSFLRRD